MALVTFVDGNVLEASELNDSFDAVKPENWQAWTPTLTGWTLGNGTVTARYWKANKTVLFEGKITWGSTTSASGLLTVSLPLTASSSGYPCGVGKATDASVRFYQVFTAVYTTTSLYFNVGGTNNGISGALYDAGGVTNTSPFTWVNTDSLTFQGMYEAA